MFNNQEKAVSNTTVSNKGQELFGNWELSDELDDADLMSVSGGGADVGVANLAHIDNKANAAVDVSLLDVGVQA